MNVTTVLAGFSNIISNNVHRHSTDVATYA